MENRRFSRFTHQAHAAPDEQSGHSRSGAPRTSPRGRFQAYADSPDLLRGISRFEPPQRNLYGEASSHRSREPSNSSSARGRSRSRGRSDDEAEREEQEYQDQMDVRRSVAQEQLYQRRSVQQRTEASSRRDSTTHKELGVICIHPDCTARVMYTQSFKGHYESQHMKPGEVYTKQNRKDYERAIDDPSLFSDPRHMQKLLSHRLQAQEQRMERVASSVDGMARNVEDAVARCVEGAVSRSVQRAVDDAVERAMEGAVARMERAFNGILDKYLQDMYRALYDDLDAKLQAMTKYLLAPPPLVAPWAGIKRQHEDATPLHTSPKVARRTHSGGSMHDDQDTTVVDEYEDKAPVVVAPVREEASQHAVDDDDDDEPMAQPDELMQSPVVTKIVVVAPRQEPPAPEPTHSPASKPPAPKPAPKPKPTCEGAAPALAAKVTSAALGEATRAALEAAATPSTSKSKAALKVVTTGAKASPKKKGRSPNTKKLQRDIKEKAKDFGRIRIQYQDTLASIDRRASELDRITSTLRSASGAGLLEAKKSEATARKLLKDAESSKVVVEAELNMYEVIATAAEGLKMLTQQKSKLRKEQGIRTDLNKEFKEDPTNANKEAAALEQKKVTKQLDDDVKQLKFEVDSMVDAAIDIMQHMKKNSVDDDLVHTGMAAGEKFKAYIQRAFPASDDQAPATDQDDQADQVEL